VHGYRLNNDTLLGCAVIQRARQSCTLPGVLELEELRSRVNEEARDTVRLLQDQLVLAIEIDDRKVFH